MKEEEEDEARNVRSGGMKHFSIVPTSSEEGRNHILQILGAEPSIVETEKALETRLGNRHFFDVSQLSQWIVPGLFLQLTPTLRGFVVETTKTSSLLLFLPTLKIRHPQLERIPLSVLHQLASSTSSPLRFSHQFLVPYRHQLARPSSKSGANLKKLAAVFDDWEQPDETLERKCIQNTMDQLEQDACRNTLPFPPLGSTSKISFEHASWLGQHRVFWVKGKGPRVFHKSRESLSTLSTLEAHDGKTKTIRLVLKQRSDPNVNRTNAWVDLAYLATSLSLTPILVAARKRNTQQTEPALLLQEWYDCTLTTWMKVHGAPTTQQQNLLCDLIKRLSCNVPCLYLDMTPDNVVVRTNNAHIVSMRLLDLDPVFCRRRNGETEKEKEEKDCATMLILFALATYRKCNIVIYPKVLRTSLCLVDVAQILKKDPLFKRTVKRTLGPDDVNSLLRKLNKEERLTKDLPITISQPKPLKPTKPTKNLPKIVMKTTATFDYGFG